MKVFVDSNVPMYVAGAEHPNRAPALRFLGRVRTGEVEAYTSTEVLLEILYRYVGLGRVDLASEVYDLVVRLSTEVVDVTLADTDRARDLLETQRTLSARDAVHAGVMLSHGLEWIATFDRGFDAVHGIRRVEL